MADKKYTNDGPSAADKALERFTDLMIEKIQTLQGDWKKPWFTPGATQPPQNLSGRHYSGGNSLMLMLQAEKMGYDIPVWGTFDRITNLNYVKDKNGNVFQARDKQGNKLPMVTVNKGEKSFPVFLTTFTVVNPETKERIPYDDYRNLSREEQSKYKVYPKLQVYNVFNVAAQTNLEVTRPEMYEKLKAQAAGQIQQQGDLKSHPAIDLMIDENLFFCPINQVKGDKAYYSPANDHIVVPKREQFVDGEAFATNTLHECAHATGADSRLDRHLGGHVVEEGGLHTVRALGAAVGFLQLFATYPQHRCQLFEFGRLGRQRLLHELETVLQLTYLVVTLCIGYRLVVMAFSNTLGRTVEHVERFQLATDEHATEQEEDEYAHDGDGQL